MEKSNNFPFNVDREELSEKKGKSKIRKSKITDEVIVKEENISIKDEDEINHNGAWSD